MFLKVLVMVMLAMVVEVQPSPGGYQPVYYPSPMPYYFDYNVYDHYGGNYHRSEHSDGYRSHGQYNVYYPGGSTQTKKY